METIYETYSKRVCANCKNRKECKEELRIRINGTIKCDMYERENKTEGHKKQIKMSITANRNKPIMKGIDK